MLRLGTREFGDHESVVMAIVDRAPERLDDREAAFSRVDRAVSEGAAAVDIGTVGDAGGLPVARAAAFVSEVRARHPELVIAVETGRPEIAEALCAAGADLVDDPSGGSDPRLARVAARHGAGLVCQGTSGAAPEALRDLAERAAGLGVRRDGILVSPGRDLAAGTPAALGTTRRLAEYAAAGWPVLASLPDEDFAAGTVATAAVAAWLGARVHRVRAVAPARQALDMVASIAGHRPPAVALRGMG